MSRFKVNNQLKVYEVDDKEPEDETILVVSSHWCFNDRIVLETRNGQRLTVIGRDLEKAITNAMNSG